VQRTINLANGHLAFEKESHLVEDGCHFFAVNFKHWVERFEIGEDKRRSSLDIAYFISAGKSERSDKSKETRPSRRAQKSTARPVSAAASTRKRRATTSSDDEKLLGYSLKLTIRVLMNLG
jgi:hypothetical protein